MGEIEWERMESGRGERTEKPGEPVWLTGSQVIAHHSYHRSDRDIS